MVSALNALSQPPKLIITDSQAFSYVYEHKPAESLLTSFSVLFARYKGDIQAFADGAKAIARLTPSSRVLIAEACAHAPLSEETKRKIGEAQKGSLNHMYGKKGFDNFSSKAVIEITTNKVFGSASVAAEKLEVNFSHVCAVARGDRGSTGGYVFRYLDENNNPIRPEHPAHIKFVKVRDSVLEEYKYLL